MKPLAPSSLPFLILALCAATPAMASALSLKECLSLAAAGNYSLAVTASDRLIAQEAITQARSGFLPRVDFQGGYTLQAKPQAVNFGERGSIETQDGTYGFFSLSVTQTIYDFGRTSSRRQRASLLHEATVQQYAAAEKDIFLQVVEAYFGILEARRLLGTAEEEVAQRTDHLQIATNLFEQGVVTRNDLLQAQVRLAESAQKRLVAANRLENCWMYLNHLTGRPLDQRDELEEGTESAMPDTAGAEERAFANRPELTALARSADAADAEVSEARSGYYPELYAKAGVDYVENSKVREQAIYAATVGLKINLFEGFATESKHRQSVERLTRSRDALRLAREQVRLELATALNDARVAEQRIKSVETAIRQGEENLRINRDRYQAQVGTATDVLDAQTLLTQIKTDYHRAVFDFQVAKARVSKAMGEL
ncbi:RND transporter [Geobacter sulfurreducens]|nr:RND transporter [Geobacter sulfurreducens]